MRSAPDALAAAPDVEVRDGQLMLSLEDAVVIALRRNLGLQVQRFRRAGAYEFIRANQGIFDLDIGFATGLFEETQPGGVRPRRRRRPPDRRRLTSTCGSTSCCRPAAS